MALFCTSCGSQMSEGARFCDNCGTQQPDRISASESPLTPPVTQPMTSQFGQPSQYAPPPPSFSPASPIQPGYGYSAPPPANTQGFMGMFSFDGRVGRLQFWLTSIATSIASSILTAITNESENIVLLLVAFVVAIVLFVIGLAITVKRWHDRDKSGWWILILLIPVIGWIWSIVETGFLRGTDGPNRFGHKDSGWPL